MKFYKVEASYYDGDESTYYSEFFCNKANAYEEYSKQVHGKEVREYETYTT